MIIPHKVPNVNKWGEHKQYSELVARHMEIGAHGHRDLQRRAERMASCGNKLFYEYNAESGIYRFAGAALCRDRLCPVCAWRLAIKRISEMIPTVDRIAELYPGSKAIHVVLTVKNCQLSDLRYVLDTITTGFTRIKKTALWKEYILGYMRSVEVSYNDETGEYHPHIHCICIVESNYIRQISIGEWSELWQKAARLDYKPHVWATHAYKKQKPHVAIEDEIYPIEQSDEILGAAKKAIIEATKYAMKPTSLVSIAQAGDIAAIARAVAGFRMISYGGCVKKIRRELGITTKDEPTEQLPETVIDPSKGNDRYYLVYEWCRRTKEYLPHEVDIRV